MVQIKMLYPAPIVKETLERIGIKNKLKKILWPSCYIVTKIDDKNYFYHFKEMLNKPELDETDLIRKNTVIWLLSKWGLIEVVDKDLEKEIFKNISEKKICVLTKKQIMEDGWKISHKIHSRILKSMMSNNS